ncbi:MAG: hypothetical protein LBQ56_06370 [Synergistaceae bacterium]|nr:hypothetical protein [Synergistaceae bacterium]
MTSEFEQLAMQEQQMETMVAKDPLLEQIEELFPTRDKVVSAVEKAFRSGESHPSCDSIVDRLPDESQKWQTLAPVELAKNPKGNRVMIFEPRIQKGVFTVNIRYSGSENLMVFLDKSKPREFVITRIAANSVEVGFPSISEIDYKSADSLENIKKVLIPTLEVFESRIMAMNAKIMQRRYELNEDIEMAIKAREAAINQQRQFEAYLND